MCEPKEAQDCCGIRVVHHGHHGAGCCGIPQRRFMTKKEKHETLEKYRDQLRNELQGVEERISDLGGE